MKKSFTLLQRTLWILLLATASCDREKPGYGEETLSPAPIVGFVSFETMQVTLNSATENYSAVVRPTTTAGMAAETAAATNTTTNTATTAGMTGLSADGTEDSGTRAETDALDGYLFNLIDKQGAAVAEFPYGAYPRFEVPAGVYTLTVQPADPQALAWETQSYRAEQEVYVRKDATTAIGEVLCTPATVGVAMTFDPAFGETAAATVVCNGEEALFTPAESRTAYFLPSEEENTSAITITVSGPLDNGGTVTFTQRFEGIRAGQLCRFTVKGSSTAPPVIEWEGHDITQRYEATAELEAKINITAAAGIRDFKVEIISEVLTPEILQGIGLTTSFDLIHPGQYAEILKGLGFPTGDAVLNQTAVSFDISPFMPLIPLLGSGDSDFKLTVTDNDDATTVASIMVHSSKEGENPEPEPEPDGPEQEFPGGGANPLDPPSSVTEEPFPGGAAGELS